MIRILFICHGNICRSPMAEFVFKHMVNEQGREHQFHIASSATSREEIGNEIHPGTRRKLKEMHVAFSPRKAVQFTKADYEKYDYILCMDSYNIRNLKRIIGPNASMDKVKRLLDFSDKPRDIADPWYTGNFDETYEDIVEGCTALLRFIDER